MSILNRIPLTDLKGYSARDAKADLGAALAGFFMTVPQVTAYAMIAELPPATGLYAAMIPAIIGSLVRSSRHVITGPSNALSLLVGSAIVSQTTGADPEVVAVTLAFIVGCFQLLSGLLGLSVVVDFVSQSVVAGYITGAAILIGIGQLPNLTSTPGGRGDVIHRIQVWIAGLGDWTPLSLAFGLGTAALIVLLRTYRPRWPVPMLALTVATLTSYLFDLHAKGLRIVSDIAAVPASLPPLTSPDPNLFSALLPAAIAATVLSLIESTSLARAIASRTGQRLDPSFEFVGQGLANLSAAFFGAYPVSGSLSRSALNERSGAVSRMAGVYGGLLLLGAIFILGPVVSMTPVSALAGLLTVVALDLIDTKGIRFILQAGWPDRLTFITTLLATWTLSLDKAIYLGVGLSLIFFLRQARLLVAREIAVDPDGRLREVDPDGMDWEPRRCTSIRILHLEGRLFFGIEGELSSVLDEFTADPSVKVLIVRLKRTQGMDASVAAVFAEKAAQMAESGRHLILVGIRPSTMKVLRSTGLTKLLGSRHVYPAQPRWFGAMREAVIHAVELTGESHSPDCPLSAIAGALDKKPRHTRALSARLASSREGGAEG